MRGLGGRPGLWYVPVTPMTFARRFAFAPLAVWAVLSCSNQGEGERCDTKSGNADCETGLICTDVGQGVSRCCPEGTSADSRCQSSGIGTGGTTSNGGSSGSSGASVGGTSGTAGSLSSGGTAGSTGASCAHNSDCATNLVCGPSGHCQLECLVDRDCATGLSCQANRCVASAGTGGTGGAGGGAGGAP